MIHPIAEFEPQSFVQLIFPHKQSDWIEYLDEASSTFVTIINAIARFENVLVICDDILRVKSYFSSHHNIYFKAYQSDDTWARDCSAISVNNNKEVELLNFTFNGWGNKFEATRDNVMSANISTCKDIEYVLEGGAIEFDSKGTLLASSLTLLNPNRNPSYTKEETEIFLKKSFGLKRILWLNHGYLAGDDTDSHIDTLARFIDDSTIMYVTCRDKKDEHYEELKAMELELKAFVDYKGNPYKLIPLPMTEAIYYESERLPATYANFLLINGAVLVPTYNDSHDEEVLELFRATCKDRKVIGIDCSILIRQHGSLHCVTMNFAKGVELDLTFI